jgi:hypothetical protein
MMNFFGKVPLADAIISSSSIPAFFTSRWFDSNLIYSEAFLMQLDLF